MRMTAGIRVRGLGKTFPGGSGMPSLRLGRRRGMSIEVLDNVNLDVEPG